MQDFFASFGLLHQCLQINKSRRTKSDINEHCDKLRELAAQADSVVEFGMRHGVSIIAKRQHRLERYGASRPVKNAEIS